MRLRALLALALILTACGGAAADTGDGVASLEDTTVTTTEAETADPEAAAIAFTECMREQGIEMEDPIVDAEGNVTPGRPTDLPEPESNEEGGPAAVGPGALGDELRAGFEECGDLLGGTAFGFTDVDQTELQDQLLELAECLRDQGLEVADPDFSEPGQAGEPGQDIEPGQGSPFGIDFQDPAVQAAMEQCQELVPNSTGGPGGRPGFNDEGAGSADPDGTDDSNN